jgi:hypothetical protein
VNIAKLLELGGVRQRELRPLAAGLIVASNKGDEAMKESKLSCGLGAELAELPGGACHSCSSSWKRIGLAIFAAILALRPR